MLELLFEILLGVELGVVAGLLEELLVAALLGDLSVFDDDDGVGVLQGGDAVADEEGGAFVHDGF